MYKLFSALQDAEKAVFNDEAEVAAARKRDEVIAQQERLREAYNELKYTAPDKVEAMRDQEMTRLKMSLAYRTGELATTPRLAMHLRNFCCLTYLSGKCTRLCNIAPIPACLTPRIGAAGDRETADMLANKLKSDEAKQRDAAAEPIN